MLLSAYEWPELVALKCMLLVYLNICFLIAAFTAGIVQRKPQQATGSPTCELQLFTSTWMCCRIDTGRLQNNSYPQLRSESLLQWHVHVQHISTLESQA